MIFHSYGTVYQRVKSTHVFSLFGDLNFRSMAEFPHPVAQLRRSSTRGNGGSGCRPHGRWKMARGSGDFHASKTKNAGNRGVSMIHMAVSCKMPLKKNVGMPPQMVLEVSTAIRVKILARVCAYTCIYIYTYLCVCMYMCVYIERERYIYIYAYSKTREDENTYLIGSDGPPPRGNSHPSSLLSDIRLQTKNSKWQFHILQYSTRIFWLF